jgi:hypothetical protein
VSVTTVCYSSLRMIDIMGIVLCLGGYTNKTLGNFFFHSCTVHLDTVKFLFYPTDAQLTLHLITTTIVAPPSNASKWQMGFNSAFKGLNIQRKMLEFTLKLTTRVILHVLSCTLYYTHTKYDWL